MSKIRKQISSLLLNTYYSQLITNQSPGEASQYQLEKTTIRSGRYTSTELHDYIKNPLAIGQLED